MPQFKVGDSVRVIGQRVCPRNGNVPIGATGKIFRIAGREYLVEFDPKIPSGEEYAWFMADSLELCHDKKFKVGDAVRVKAGSLVYGHMPHFTLHAAPYERSFGKMLLITGKNNSQFPPANSPYGHWECLDRSTGRIDWVTGDYLEPWNDAEEWNGTAWVAKKKSEPKRAVVRPGQGSEYYSYPSTNVAVRFAEKQAAAYPGTEFVVYQEKESFKVEKPIRKIGSQWRVCWRQDLDDHPYFANGTIVTLIHDDGSSSPTFSGPGKDNGEMRSACVAMKRLEPV